VYQYGGGLSLEGRLGRNEKVEQYVRKKTHKPNALRFWVEGGVIPSCGLALFSFLFEIRWCRSLMWFGPVVILV